MKQDQAAKRIPLTALVLEVAWKSIWKISKNIGRETKISCLNLFESFCVSPKLIRVIILNVRATFSKYLSASSVHSRSTQINSNYLRLQICAGSDDTASFPSMALASFRSLHQPKIYGLVSMISVILDCQVAFRS